MNYEISVPPEDLVALPPLASVIRSQVYHFQSRRILRRFAAESDVLFIRVPFQLPSALVGLKTPKLVHVVGNPYQVIAASTDYRGPMRFLALRFAVHTGNAIRRMCHEPHTRVAANGREMWDLLGCRDGRVVVSSCIRESEMRPRQDMSLQRSAPICCSSAICAPRKASIICSMRSRVLRRKRPLQLTLVGGSDRASKVEAKLRERLRSVPSRRHYGRRHARLWRRAVRAISQPRRVRAAELVGGHAPDDRRGPQLRLPRGGDAGGWCSLFGRARTKWPAGQAGRRGRAGRGNRAGAGRASRCGCD